MQGWTITTRLLLPNASFFLYDDSDLPLRFSGVSDALTLLPLLRLGRLLFSGVLRLCDRRLELANKLEERIEGTKCRTTRAT